MTGLTTDQITHACRIFFRLAYPAGEETIPEKRRIYLHLPPGQELADYHSHHPFPAASFQTVTDPDGKPRGFSFRLGSVHFPHLKLKVQWMENHDNRVWVFSVDTHDAFSRESIRPPADHPDALAWNRLQQNNAELKEKIEHAWEDAGLLTFNALLRQDLNRTPADPPG